MMLPSDNPLVEELNQSYIELQKKYLAKDLTNNNGEGLLAVSLGKQPSNFRKKPLPTAPLATAPRQTETSANQDQKLHKLVEAAEQTFENRELRAILNAPWFIVLMSILLFFCCAKLYTSQFQESKSSQPTAAMLQDFSGMKFTTSDRKIAMRFLSKEECAIDQSGHSSLAKYTPIANGELTSAAIWWGYLRRNELWYQYDGARLVSTKKVSLYDQNSPELVLVGQMWWYANFAQKYYQESKLYPSDAEKCKQFEPNFVYNNPITHQKDYAAIVFSKQPDGFSNVVVRGRHERQWRPGAILCWCSNYHKFSILGFDRDAKPIVSSDPSRYFVIECDNGVNVTRSKQDNQKNDLQNDLQFASDKAPIQVFISDTATLGDTVDWLRRLFQIVLWTIFGSACFWCYASHKSDNKPQLRLWSKVPIAISLLCLTIWYVGALQPSA